MNLKQIDRAIAHEDAIIAKANVMIAMAEARRAAFMELRRLHSGNSGSTVVASMETDHRLAISSGRTSEADKKFAAACRAAGYTPAALAAKLGFNRSTLSRYRSGLRETPQDVKERIAELIDWPADSKHWPKKTS